eukprot:Nk52_evm17s248 gene=Nk52_evmTU17s248
MKAPKKIKIIITGFGGVGKSCLVLQYLNGEFVGEYEPTKADSFRKKMKVDEKEILLEILDTAGQEEYHGVMDTYLRTGDGFIVVFSVAEKSTFDMVDEFRENILRNNEEKFARGKDDANDYKAKQIILVGNKCDLKEGREVTRAEAEEKAASWKAKYIETSAKENINVTQMFETLVVDVKGINKKKKTEQKKCIIL